MFPNSVIGCGTTLSERFIEPATAQNWLYGKLHCTSETQYPMSHDGKADIETICSYTKLLAGLTHGNKLVSFLFEVMICSKINQE